MPRSEVKRKLLELQDNYRDEKWSVLKNAAEAVEMTRQLIWSEAGINVVLPSDVSVA